MLKARVFDGFTASDIEEHMNKFFLENTQMTRSKINEFQLKKDDAEIQSNHQRKWDLHYCIGYERIYHEPRRTIPILLSAMPPLMMVARIITLMGPNSGITWVPIIVTEVEPAISAISKVLLSLVGRFDSLKFDFWPSTRTSKFLSWTLITSFGSYITRQSEAIGCKVIPREEFWLCGIIDAINRLSSNLYDLPSTFRV